LDPGAPIFQFRLPALRAHSAVLFTVAKNRNRRQFFVATGHSRQSAPLFQLIGMAVMIIALANLPLATANAVFLRRAQITV